jgi:hypothetical protein
MKVTYAMLQRVHTSGLSRGRPALRLCPSDFRCLARLSGFTILQHGSKTFAPKKIQHCGGNEKYKKARTISSLSSALPVFRFFEEGKDAR